MAPRKQPKVLMDTDKMTDAELIAYIPNKEAELMKAKAAADKRKEEKEKEVKDNAAFITTALGSWGLPPVDPNDQNAIIERTMLYFKNCVNENIRPNLPGVCNYLQIDRKTFEKWEAGKEGYPLQTTAKRIIQTLEQLWADLQLQNKTYPATGIFLGKNWFDYKDQKDVVLDTEARREATAEELAKEAMSLPFEDVDLS